MQVIVVDGPVVDVAGEAVFTWRGYAEDGRITSIPRHLERHGDRFRARYLAFVHDLGETVVAGRPLSEHFRLPDGNNLWWLNRVAEKNTFKSPRIVDCLRLLALEELLAACKAAHLTLHTADRALKKAVAALCASSGIEFACVLSDPPSAKWSIRRLYDALPWTVQGLFSFRHVLRRWRFRRLRPRRWFTGASAIFVCSYLYTIDEDAARRGAFNSRQWEGLPALLRERGAQANWVHHYQPDGPRDVRASAALLETLNRDAERQGRHIFVETFVSWPLLLVIVRRWLWLHAVGRRLRHIASAFRPDGSAACMWPLLRDDWWNSLHGTAAVSNCTWLTLFNAILADVPPQPLGLYLYEGQGWEAAFVQAWRSHGHGELIGVPHSSMPFWYLSIYDDARCVVNGACGKPLPDRWALNGPMAWRALTFAGYPDERLVPVEALRYTYLQPFAAQPKRQPAAPRAGDRAIQLLVLGDFRPVQTQRMLERLAAAMPRLDRACDVAVKLHPACPISPDDAPAGLACEFTTRPLGELLPAFDVAFVSNTTSAGIDAILGGLPVVVFLDDDDLNQSPLRGAEGVAFVSTVSELAGAIRGGALSHDCRTSFEEFFWIDPALPRWRRALWFPEQHA
jgi:surface carbohydrate biosynthesis protein (TIGR04326 family)